MPSSGWRQVLVSADVDGPPITNSVTQISIIPTDCKYTLPGNFLRDGGRQLQITASGRISNVITTPGTLLFQVLFGAIAVFSPVAFPLNAVAKTNVPWWLEILLTMRTAGTGTAATLFGSGTFQSESTFAQGVGGGGTAGLSLAPPAVGTGFDSTVSNAVDLQAKFSVATATTALTMHTYRLESVN